MDDINSLIETVTNQFEGLVSKILETKIVIPSYRELTTKEKLFSSYGKIIEEFDQVTQKSIMIQKAVLDIERLKEVVDKSPLYTIVEKTRVTKAVISGKDKLKNYLNIVNTYKDNLANVLRFYGSVQYMLGSPRFEGYN